MRVRLPLGGEDMKTEEQIKERRSAVMEFLTRPDLSMESIRYYQGEIAGLDFLTKEEPKDD